MWLVLTLLATVLGAAAGWQTPFDRFIAITNPLVVTFTIMAAAILVRMNRGMPTLDWKTLEPIERERLTGNIVELTRTYLVVLALQAAAIVLLIAFGTTDNTMVGAAAGAAHPHLVSPPPEMAQTTSAFVGGLITLSFARMAYVVWRDYDIVRLQKKLIDDAAAREAAQANVAAANGIISAMKASGLRPIPATEPKAWSDP